ncbi:CHRD domain-containing protein [Spirosoma rhododendri]|uniref:CHRD domain-containing protein n=1 Tax=Spirosoma rhododendri TaxID=2728024 RepID=A0A7L5DU95_9BACT|nr:CHRD domain-containing protein [Spirosoma rhododendri]QJD79130.1 CHRD domain-containing protein [Spirosoma rhododendri]
MKHVNLLMTGLALLVMGFVVSACKDEENPITTVSTRPTTTASSYTATMNGASEKPTATTSTASGSTRVLLNETTRAISYTVTYSGLTPVAGHIHRITPNSTSGTGGVEIPFSSLTSPIVGSYTLASQARVDSFKNGYYYSNLHTTAYPNGEIRGDIKK